MNAKKVIAAICMFLFLLTLALPVAAKASGLENPDPSQQAFLGKLVEEALKGQEVALSSANQDTQKFYYKGLILEFMLCPEAREETYSLRTHHQTATSSCQVKNIFGDVLGTLTATGTFELYGSTAKPISASGSSNVPSYTVSTSTHLGPEQSNAWLTVSFDGTCTQTPSTFHLVCTITCDGKGTCSASWTS